MKKAIAIMSEDEKLNTLDLEMDALKQRTKERLKFLERQAKGIFEEAQTEKMKLWSQIESKLEQNGKLPITYNKDKHYLQIENGVMYMHDQKDACECGVDHGDDKLAMLKQIISKVLGVNPETEGAPMHAPTETIH